MAGGADEIVINDAEEQPPQEGDTTNIVVVATTPSPDETPSADYVTRAEFETYCSEHAETGHGDLREKIGVLAGIEALLVEDEIQENQEEVIEEQPPTETSIDGETQEEEQQTQSERHAGLFA